MTDRYDDRFLNMSWVEMALMIEALEEHVATLKSTVRHLEHVLVGIDEDKMIVELKDEIAEYAVEANNWYEIACELFDAVLAVQDQLSERGIGLRPAAQEALRKFEEYEATYGDEETE